MKGWEIIKTIEENISDGVIGYLDKDNNPKMIEVKNKKLCWKPGEFTTDLLTSDIDFIIAEDSTKAAVALAVKKMNAMFINAGSAMVESFINIAKMLTNNGGDNDKKV